MGLNWIDERRDAIEAKREKAYGLLTECDDSLAVLSSEVLSGRRGEDVAKDFAMVHHGVWDDETLAPYRDLVKRTRANVGNEVLVVGYNISESDSGVRNEPFYNKLWCLKRGVVSSPLEFDVSNGGIVVPSNGHLSMSGSSIYLDGESLDSIDFTSSGWDYHSGNIEKDLGDLPHLEKGEKCSLDNTLALHTGWVCSGVLFGGDVKKYFDKKESGDVAYSCVSSLSSLVSN